jgi:hypothetical protein
LQTENKQKRRTRELKSYTPHQAILSTETSSTTLANIAKNMEKKKKKNLSSSMGLKLDPNFSSSFSWIENTSVPKQQMVGRENIHGSFEDAWGQF